MIYKTLVDYLLALILLFFLVGLIALLIICSSIDTREYGLFTQTRIGKSGKHFNIYKIRTMRGEQNSTVTTKAHKITSFGKFLRNYKLDELPQLFNILKGEMSFVGPRPDVQGYADVLVGEDRIILSVKPGITGPAQLKYRNEESILSQVENPLQYNDNVLWPDKIKINKEYVQNWSFTTDIYYIVKTIL